MGSLLKLEHNLNATVDIITEAKEEFIAQIRDVSSWPLNSFDG
jgi:hypothetical protein